MLYHIDLECLSGRADKTELAGWASGQLAGRASAQLAGWARAQLAGCVSQCIHNLGTRETTPLAGIATNLPKTNLIWLPVEQYMGAYQITLLL